MANDNPFFLTRVECPICKTINEFETVRMGAYVEEGRDTDFCPRGITWRYPRYQAHNPLVFFIAACSNCFYARELNNSFKEWKNDNTYRTYRLKTIKGKHLDQLAQADSVLKKVGEAIDIQRYPNESAILKLHLAVYNEQLTEHYSKLDVGRFYLRIGWVFRGLEQLSNPQQSLRQGLVTDLDEHYRQLVDTARRMEDQVNRFTDQMASYFDRQDITSELKSRLVPFRDRFDEAITSVRDTTLQTVKGNGVLGELVAEYKTTALGGDGFQGGISFHDYPSFFEFLVYLKGEWSWAAASEREALEKAVHYYKEAFTDGRDIAPGNQQIQASYLIAELSRRIGNYDEARQYFNSTIKHGQEFVYRHRNDRSKVALARKILELAVEQGKSSMAEAATATV
ncbi:MAG: DUF2225 domain-containing protein [bacterium]